MKKNNRLVLIPVAIVLIVCFALVSVYYLVPVIQPCALLAQVVPPPLLPPNPNVSGLAFTPLPGARAMTGEYACSGYRFEVPDNWNGDLVVYAHGFRADSAPDVYVTDLPVRAEAIAQGYAWAASSYRQNGYNPLDGIEDTRLMIEQFKQKVGEPNKIFIYGSSMGGHVVVGSMEKYPEVYAGGVAECGAVGGAGEIDYLVASNMLADYLAGVDMFAPENRGLSAQIALLEDKIYPALGAPPNYDYDDTSLNGNYEPAPQVTLTDKGEVLRNGMVFLSGGPRPFAQEGFGASYSIVLFASRAIYSLFPKLLAVGSNDDITYQVRPGLSVTSEQINESVRRIAADPAQRARYEFTGNLQAPLLTIHDTGDLFVPIYNEQVYRRLAERAGKGDLLVQRAVRRFLHCDFSLLERNRAFNDLVNWVNNRVKPEGEDLLGSLENAGLQFTDPLRQDDPGHLE